MNKNRRDKIIAAIIWHVMLATSIGSIINIVGVLGVAVEAMEITARQIGVVTVSALWLVAFGTFVTIMSR